MNEIKYLNDLENLDKIRHLNTEEISKRLEHMGYDYNIYCNDSECKVINGIFILPRINGNFNQKSRIFDVESDVIDYLHNLGFKISYISFFGEKIGVWFEKIKKVNEE